MTSNEKKLVQEYYREKLFKKIKKCLNNLLDKRDYKEYDKVQKAFQNGWNDAIKHFIDNELEDIE